MNIKTRLVAGASTLALAGGMMAIAAPAATAATTLVTCSGTSLIASLNPTLGSSDAKYTKAASKRNDGSINHLSLTGSQDLGPSVSDATSCSVDSGIRTTNAGTNSLGAVPKDNPFDNQTADGSEPGGYATLTMGSIASAAKIAGVTAGSASCNRADPGLVTTYPRAYPLNGKLTYKFLETTPALVQIQSQFYVRLGTDPIDTDITHITVTGISIKGPGVGGNVSGTLAFGAAFAPTKNINLLDCTADGTPPAAGNASLGSLIITPADGSDAGVLVDDLTVSIP